MKKHFLIIAFLALTITKGQSIRNDSYTALGVLTSFNEIPFGIGFYNVTKEQRLGVFSELKFNRLNFNNDYIFRNAPVASDTLRDAIFHGNKNMIKMINIGLVFNPQKLNIFVWDRIDIDLCLGIGYVQNFRYKFYHDSKGIEKDENQSSSNPLGKYYVIDHNDHGINLNIGTNLSFQKTPFMIHLGYDFKPKTIAFGFNWKVK